MTTEQTSQQMRADWLPRAIISGFIAAIAMLFTFMLAYGLAYLAAQLPPPASQSAESMRSWFTIRAWFYGLTHNSLTDLAGSNLYAVAGLHFGVAMAWAALYGCWAEPRLSGPGWLRGMIFSLLPAIISILALLPLGGGGFLGWGLGAGPFPIFGNLILHLAYGAALGAVYGPLGDVPADYSPGGAADDLATTRRSEVPIARGIVAGLVVGLLVSIGVSALLHAAPGTPILDVPQAAFVLGATVVGGAFGGFLGSFAGLAGQA